MNYNKTLDSYYKVVNRKRTIVKSDIRGIQPTITGLSNKIRAIIYYYYVKKPWDKKALRQLMKIQVDQAVAKIRSQLTDSYADALKEKLDHYNLEKIATNAGFDKAQQLIDKEMNDIKLNKKDYLNKQTDIKKEGDVINELQTSEKNNTGHLETFESLKGVASTWIEGVRYENTTQQLWIKAHNRWYIWISIPEKVYDEFVNPAKNSFAATYNKISGKGSGSGIGTSMWRSGRFFKNPELGLALLTTVAKGKKWTEKKREKVEKWAIAQINKSWQKNRKKMIGVLKEEAKKNVDFTGFVFSDVLGSDFRVSDTRMDVVRPTKSVLKTWQRQNLRSYYRDLSIRKANKASLRGAKKIAQQVIGFKQKSARKQFSKKNLNKAIKIRKNYKIKQVRSKVWERYNQGKLDPRKVLKRMGIKLNR